MKMRALATIAILSTNKITDIIVTERGESLAQALKEQLKITGVKVKALVNEAVLVTNNNHLRGMKKVTVLISTNKSLIGISKGNAPTMVRRVLERLQDATICPLARTLKTASDTLTAGDLHYMLLKIRPNIKDLFGLETFQNKAFGILNLFKLREPSLEELEPG